MSDSNTSITEIQDEISQNNYVQPACSSSCSILSFNPAEEEYVENDDIHEVIKYNICIIIIIHYFSSFFFFGLIRPSFRSTNFDILTVLF